MTKIQLEDIVHDFIASDEIPAIDSQVLCDLLLEELESNWDNLPSQTQAVVLAVAGGLKKRHLDELHSDVETRALLKKLRDG